MHEGHNHAPAQADTARDPELRRRLATAFAIIASIVVAQGIGAAITGSLALLVDMVHSLTDSLGLLVALVTAILIARPADSHKSWGYRRLEVLSAFVQALLLLGVGIFAVVNAIQRLMSPVDVAAQQVVWFGVYAIVANIAAAAILNGRRNANLNMRAAFLEVAMDALGTIAVIVGALVAMLTGFQRADSIAALVIAALILPRAAVLLRDAVRILLEYSPSGMDLDAAKRHILEIDHVRDVHDLHASTISTGLPQLSVHVVVDPNCFADGHAVSVLNDVRECAAEHFPVKIEHVTVQIEPADGRVCDEVCAA